MPAAREHGRGYTLIELAVCVGVLAALVGMLLLRTQSYAAQAERIAVDQTVASLRTALRLRVADAGRPDRPYRPERLVNENPFDWLDHKPDNYLGEYYSVETEKIPVGNWVFDRRDKTVAYLPKTAGFSYTNATKFLKFKVESAQLYGHAPAQGSRKQGWAELELHQVSQSPADIPEN
jgi:type II secretory pathway pseudopilin PulG